MKLVTKLQHLRMEVAGKDSEEAEALEEEEEETLSDLDLGEDIEEVPRLSEEISTTDQGEKDSLKIDHTEEEVEAEVEAISEEKSREEEKHLEAEGVEAMKIEEISMIEITTIEKETTMVSLK